MNKIKSKDKNKVDMGKKWIVADKYMNKMRNFFMLSGTMPNSFEIFGKKIKSKLSKKELYQKILAIQTEFKNDEVAQKEI